MNRNESVEGEFEEHWPQDGERLFVESSWAYDAHVVRDPDERFYRMPMGYKRAGDLLVDQARVDVTDRRNIIYAALFCYRQSIELFLKWIIHDFGDDDSKTAMERHHRLADLWGMFLRVVDERSTREADGLRAVEVLINELHRTDQASDGFRYPYAKNAAPFGFGDCGVDLDNLRLVMQGLANFFDCTHTAFDEDEKADSESMSYYDAG